MRKGRAENSFQPCCITGEGRTSLITTTLHRADLLTRDVLWISVATPDTRFLIHFFFQLRRQKVGLYHFAFGLWTRRHLPRESTDRETPSSRYRR